MTELIMKYKPLIAYLFFGVCTTITNLIVYYLCSHIFNFSTMISTTIAWFFAVVFAYLTNKIWVFDCKSWEKNIVIKEVVSFFSCRILTGILDLIIMTVCVDFLLFNDLIIKIISNLLVIILNYIASKFVIFKRSN